MAGRKKTLRTLKAVDSLSSVSIYSDVIFDNPEDAKLLEAAGVLERVVGYVAEQNLRSSEASLLTAIAATGSWPAIEEVALEVSKQRGNVVLTSQEVDRLEGHLRQFEFTTAAM